MGALPRLKLKDQLHYRKGSTNESQNCMYCKNITKDFPIRGKENDPRCRVMGLRESIRYRVRIDYTCDVQQFDGTDFSKGYDQTETKGA